MRNLSVISQYTFDPIIANYLKKKQTFATSIPDDLSLRTENVI